MADLRRLHPRLTETDLDSTPFVPELSPVVHPHGDGLVTRPWLDWARRLTLLVQIKTGGGGTGDNPDHVVGPDGAGPDDIAIYNGSTGKIIKDSLKTIGGVISDAVNQSIAAILPGGKLPLTNLPLHHLTHQVGGNDVADVKLLGGFPGTSSTFLNGAGAFTIPAGGVGGGMNLDYLGNYTSGPTYFDGDIVIGSDGVAYMCVVDGTLTPPEPWPGAGVAVNGTVDATYWTVSPHTQLTNERAMNALGTGYVRSTVGEPSVVATIPLTDTTGILPDNRLTSNVALKNIDNLFSATQTLPSYSTIYGAYSNLRFVDPVASVGGKNWRLLNYHDGHFYVEGMNDADNAVAIQYQFNRNGTLTAPAFSGNGASLVTLNAAQLATGIAPTARLGTGTANASTYLRGDSTWQAIPSAIPSGMVVMSSIPCPPGWTRIGGAGVDGAYVLISDTWGSVGGANTHSHSLGSLSIPAHSHPTATADPVGDHAHNFGIHAYFDSGDNNAGQLNVDGGGSGNMARSPHGHRTQIDFDGGTANAGNHAHTVPIPAAGAIGLQGGMDAALNMPVYFSVILCYKN